MPVGHGTLDKPSQEGLNRALEIGRLFGMQALMELFAQLTELIEPSFDLLQGIGSRLANILIFQLNDHLGEPGDRPNQVNRIIFTCRQAIGWHLSASLLPQLDLFRR